MRENLNDLTALIAVAQERSFTAAAAKLGTSQSALSRTIRNLELRIGMRLLTRTTRSVTPTDAGRRLLAGIGPHLDEINAELQALSDLRDVPAGTIRINSSDHALKTAIWPRLDAFAARYPEIRVEVDVENGLIDIVEKGYDAGVRLGEEVARDMIATRIAPDWRMAVVAAPSYFADRPIPRSPDELTGHNCINLRLISYGGFYAWEFEKDGRRLNVRVDGQLAFNGSAHVLKAALAGHGIGCVPEDVTYELLQSGALVQVLGDWMPTFEGYHLYYPNRQHSAAFQLFIDAMRYRGPVTPPAPKTPA
ncbi:MAG: LysR family transcriptional regulator [Devosia sp.]|uniref:LysR family transcriptional regulator n=1 Tax=Devosia sp. TaxID=1871048 RepID=UPI0024CAFEDF|nr:LysR family transcriptional regulator [Devosia sp.]UYN99388.1 MAG: LysR family transcriptional regulator [Devosia sp.]